MSLKTYFSLFVSDSSPKRHTARSAKAIIPPLISYGICWVFSPRLPVMATDSLLGWMRWKDEMWRNDKEGWLLRNERERGKEVCETSQKGIVASREDSLLGFFFSSHFSPLGATSASLPRFGFKKKKKKITWQAFREGECYWEEKKSNARFWLFLLGDDGMASTPPCCLLMICKI